MVHGDPLRGPEWQFRMRYWKCSIHRAKFGGRGMAAVVVPIVLRRWLGISCLGEAVRWIRLERLS